MKKNKLNIKKMVLCAIFASLAFVLNTFVYFPAMAPFQHFVDVVAAVFLGPWWACLSAFLCGIMSYDVSLLLSIICSLSTNKLYPEGLAPSGAFQLI